MRFRTVRVVDTLENSQFKEILNIDPPEALQPETPKAVCRGNRNGFHDQSCSGVQQQLFQHSAGNPTVPCTPQLRSTSDKTANSKSVSIR